MSELEKLRSSGRAISKIVTREMQFVSDLCALAGMEGKKREKILGKVLKRLCP